MANFDTAAKRFSGLCLGDMLPVTPIPDGTIGAGDRLHFLDLYSGIAALIAPAFSYPDPSIVYVGVAATISPTSTGGAVPAGGWTLEAGTLPGGLSLDADTGVISGTPTTVETQTITIRATNVTGFFDFEFDIDVQLALADNESLMLRSQFPESAISRSAVSSSSFSHSFPKPGQP